MPSEKRKHELPIVLFDSSMLIDLLQCRINLEFEIERVLTRKFAAAVLSGTLSEIEDVMRRSKGDKRKKQMKAALEIAEKFNKLNYFPVDEEEMDDVIVRAAKDLKAAVATNDYELRKRLVKVGIPVLFVRDKSHIEMDGYLSDLGTSLST